MMRIFALLLVTVSMTPAVSAQEYRLDEAHSQISGRVAFLGLGSKTVHFPKATGSITLDLSRPDLAALDIALDARALTASDATTQNELKGPSFFDVAHYPAIRFIGQHITLSGTQSAEVEGVVTARGVSRPVTLNVSFARDVSHFLDHQPVQLKAQTTLDRTAFGMTAYRLIVGRMVTVTIDATMIPVVVPAA